MKPQTMANKNLLVLLVGILALALFSTASVSAFGTIADVEVSGIDALGGSVNLANFAGDKVPVLVTFGAQQPAEDVRIKAWISGERENAAVSERFDVIAGRTYSKVLYVPIPSDLDERDESRKLEIVVESRNAGTAAEVTIDLTVQRESYRIEILSVQMPSKVKAGEVVPVDVVLKNRGRQFAEDNYLRIVVPELGLETRTYFGDLSPVDQGGHNPEKEDAVERRAFLRLPSTVQSGLYTVQLEAFNEDSVAKAEKKLLVADAGADTSVVASSSTKTFSVGQTQEYTMTIVNRGTSVGIYELTVNAPSELNVDVDEPVVVVPAGSSRSVKINAESSDEGVYTFAVNVETENGQVLQEKSFKANVKGTSSAGVAQNTTLLLTVILAIVFVVLLVVLIVLLTRKPAKTEEFGESYY